MKRLIFVFSIFFIFGCKDRTIDPPKPTEKIIALNFVVNQVFDSLPFDYDVRNFVTEAGNPILFSNLKYFLSDFRLVKTDGTEIILDSSFAFVNLKTGRDTFSFSKIPAGNYTSIRFKLGLDSSVNHSDPNNYPVTHPLSPSVNQMHWGWAGGYVFMMLEGTIKDSSNTTRGYSYHLANDENLRTIECSMPFSIDSTSKTVHLEFNAAEIFKNPYLHNFNRALLTTHSSADGGLATKLINNTTDAFRISKID
jgi:hypothetical protein